MAKSIQNNTTEDNSVVPDSHTAYIVKSELRNIYEGLEKLKDESAVLSSKVNRKLPTTDTMTNADCVEGGDTERYPAPSESEIYIAKLVQFHSELRRNLKLLDNLMKRECPVVIKEYKPDYDPEPLRDIFVGKESDSLTEGDEDHFVKDGCLLSDPTKIFGG